MLKNYLKIVLRTLRRYPGYTFINVFGLAVGLACCLLIVLFVRDEVSFDRFHTKADRIVRVTQHLHNSRQGEVLWAMSPDPIAAALEADFPEIERTVRIGVSIDRLVQQGDTRFYEEGFAFADPTLFDLFDFPVLRGDPATSLVRPFTVFLSESTARKYFSEEDPLGKLLTLDNQYTFEVAGVFADLPDNTHLAFDFVASRESIYAMGRERGNWYTNALTYLLLSDQDAAANLEVKLPAFARKHLGDRAEGVEFSLVPLKDIHLYAANIVGDIKPQGDIRYVYLFSAIVLLILAIACINYMNLATARAAGRAREVGVRKVVGAGRGQLIRQFLSESIVLSLIAFVGALALVEALLPLFNTLMERSLVLDFTENLQLVAGLGAAVLFVGIAAGSYPALFLSAFRPARVLKGDLRTKTSGALRKGLVVFQFGVSVTLIACTVFIQRQMHFVQQQRPGFDEAQVVIISTRGGMVGRDAMQNALKGRYASFKAALLQHPSVEHVATTASLMGAAEINFLKGDNFEDAVLDGDASVVMDGFYVDHDFFETMGLDFVAGRPFSEASPSDTESALIINETAARKLGWEEPIGKWMQPHDQRLNVIGVVKDFHYKTHKAAIEPLYLRLTSEASNFVIAKLRPGDLPSTLSAMEAIWDQMAPALPFRYSFLDDEFDTLYRAEQRLGRLFSAFAFFAIVVACLGLFGLAAFTAEQRTKEIGIRKILGASVTGLVALLSKDFLRLLLIAFIAAVPVAYLAMERWLEDFAYRIDLGVGTFALAGGLALGIAMLTVSYQAIRAALADPVKALRYE